MWQVEDLIRANGCDIERIRRAVVEPYPISPEQKAELAAWYEELIDMMQREGVTERGHLQMNRNIITWLTDLHLQLMRSPKFPYYNAAYYKALPFIVELRARGAHHDEPEVEISLEALYGILLLKLQKKPVSPETAKAQEALSAWLGMLSEYYKDDKQGKLELN
jgi:hypothetical protein